MLRNVWQTKHSKKSLDEGLVFYRSIERGKCFIEYIPAEKAWVPIEANGYMYINCLWVSGRMKGHGYSNDLLNHCIQDAKAQGKKVFVSFLPIKEKKSSYPIPNTYPIKASLSQIQPIRAST